MFVKSETQVASQEQAMLLTSETLQPVGYTLNCFHIRKDFS